MYAKGSRFRLGLIGVLACVAFTPAQAAEDTGVAKVDALLAGTSYAYKTIAPGVWTIDFNTPPLGAFKLLAGAENGILTGFVVIAKTGTFMPSGDLMTELLHYDTTLDTARVGLDADGDLVVETKLPIRTLDGEELKAEFDEVAAAANSVYGKLAPALKK